MISISQFESSYQKLIERFTRDEFKNELFSAKKDFFQNAGTLDETNANFNLRMSQFYDWFFLDRPMSSYFKTPLAVAHEQRDLRLVQDDLNVINVLKGHEHSIYEFVKSKGEVFQIKDLFSGEKKFVENSQTFFNFDEKEFFEARLVDLDGKKFFLKGFCFHPESAQKFILSQIKNYKANPDLQFKDFLKRLNKMRYKFEQYRHVKIEMIYNDENKLGL
jgi:hypothetical protein